MAFAHDSAWLASLSVSDLKDELMLAASRLASTHVSEARSTFPAVCHECAATHRDNLLSIPHRETCRTGAVIRVLWAISGAIAEGRFDSDPPRKETAAPKDTPSGAAARETRPQPFLVRRNALPGLYHEPWEVDERGDVVDAGSDIVVDSYGCTLPEPDDQRAMRRIVACVNACDGIATEDLKMVAGGAR